MKNQILLFFIVLIYNSMKAQEIKTMTDLHKNIELITFCGGGHEFSGYLFHDGKQYVLDFVNDVSKGKKFESHLIIPSRKKGVDSGKYLLCE